MGLVFVFCIFGYVYVWTLGFDVLFFGMLYHSWFVWSIGHFGHCFEAQPPKPYFVLAQNIKLIHSFISGRMNLPVPFVCGTMLTKPFYSGIFGGSSHLSICMYDMFYL